jgi:hypothetical protein
MTKHSIANHESRKINEFFGLLAGTEKSYSNATFSFLAVKNDTGSLTLFQGHVALSASPKARRSMEILTSSICGYSVSLSELNVDYMGLVDALMSDGVETPVGRLEWGTTPGESSTSLSAHFERFPFNFNQQQAHPLLLTLSGARHLFINRSAEFQNDLRAASTPYDSVTELATEFGLRPLRWDMCTLDMSAQPTVSVELGRTIENCTATLALLVAPNIDIAPARLGYRVQGADGEIVERASVDGKDLKWRTTEAHRVGEFRVGVPEGAAIQCFASYNGQWSHQGWITDPRASANVRRVAHGTFDEELSGVMRCISDKKLKETNARIAETGIANLLYMLGFAVNPLAAPHMSDGPDILASTLSGNLLVVECTTGAIDNDGKLSKLLSRKDLLSERLHASGHGHIRCLPVMVTTLKLENTTHVQHATEKGVVVIGKEELESWLETTKSVQDADQLFERYWQQTQLHDATWDALNNNG